MQTAEYERLVLQELRRILMAPGGQAENLERRGETHKGVRVEEVRLDDSGPEREIVVLFRDPGRPECLFGYRIEALETPDILHEGNNPYLDPASAARGGLRTHGSSLKRRSSPSAAGCRTTALPKVLPG